jgi:hypothetical protein
MKAHCEGLTYRVIAEFYLSILGDTMDSGWKMNILVCPYIVVYAILVASEAVVHSAMLHLCDMPCKCNYHSEGRSVYHRKTGNWKMILLVRQHGKDDSSYAYVHNGNPSQSVPRPNMVGMGCHHVFWPSASYWGVEEGNHLFLDLKIVSPGIPLGTWMIVHMPVCQNCWMKV